MFSILVSLVVSLVLSAVTTPLVRRAALAVGAVDEPSARRVHTRRIPRLGGLAIITGFFGALLVLFALNTSVATMLFSRPRLVAGLVVGSLLVAGLGVFDDIVGVGAKQKLVVQTVAACIAYAAGFRIEIVTLPVIGSVHLGLWALPVTVLWITGIVNALNLIDGLDGLAGGIAFFACVTNFVTAYIGGNPLICLFAATLGGSIVGFLFFNFNPATIFMGDSGALFLGFVLATISLFGAGAPKGGTAIAILVPILALGVPIMDTLFAMVRRFLERRSIFAPDRSHVHHVLLDLGLTHRRAVLLLYATSCAFTVGALVVYLGHSWQIGITLVALAVALVVFMRFIGAFSYSLQRTSLRQKSREPCVEALRRALPLHLSRIDGARTADDLPELLERFARDASILAVEIVAPAGARVPSFRWEEPLADGARAREAVALACDVRDTSGVSLSLRFQWESSAGEASPQAEILLQLVADAVERLVQRPALAREATRTGRLRPVS